jgi:hypothetical protein
MRLATKTLAAINAYYEQSAKQEFRRHLGASVIGRPCTRAIWYAWRWTKVEKFEGRMLRLFERGQMEEDRFIKYLRAIGCEVWPFKDEATKKQWKVTGVDGHFGGSLDGVGRGLPDLPPDMPFLIECKTHNNKSFEKLKEDGLQKAKWEHFIQCQTYSSKMKLPACLYMAVNKDTDELLCILVMPDIEQAQRTEDRARLIIYSHEAPPRINKSPGYWVCKFCHFAKICHNKQAENVARNCRTCEHSRPASDGSGEWLCNQPENDAEYGDNVPLNEEAQLKGCDRYQLKTGLFSEP